MNIEKPLISDFYRYNNLQKIEKQINDSILQLGTKEVDYTKQSLQHATLVGSQAAADVLNTNVLNKSAIDELIKRPWHDANFSDRIWKNKAQLINSLKSELTNGIIQGKSIYEVANTIDGRLDVGRGQTQRLVRTEYMHALNQGQIESYRAKGYTKLKWIATMDDKTSKICRKLNRKEFDIENLPDIPAHPNCRCTMVPVIDMAAAEKRGDEIRKLKEQISGKTDDTSLDKVYNDDREIESIKKYMDSIDINTASHADITSLGSLVNSKFDVASKIGDKQALKDVFSNFREIGGTVPKNGWAKGSAKDTKARLTDAFSFYPKEWAEYAHANGKTIYSKNVDRGFFSDVGLKGRTWRSGIVDNGVSIMLSKNSNTVSFHEIGHYVEHFNPDALKLSKEFLAYRTKGEQEEPIKNTLYWYGVNEKTKKDNFITPYIGKTYSNATEILSVGLESLFEPGKGKIFSQTSRRSEVVMKKISDDPEYLNFIIGMILKG
ncbi:hypothetical protein RU88_GL000254 [Lactococcus raffinolactis]|nr:hypothetical protein RU88_GL000254 [Lactococcus raffinolactis]